MSDDDRKTPTADASRRLSFPQAEAQHAWLPLLLEAAHIVSEGVDEAIRREQAQGRTLACQRGCAACCRAHRDIPVYPLELIGLNWYAVEQVEGPVRATLKRQLAAHRAGEPCPFLVDDVCSVHPMRPFACRQFNVFGRVCAEGEDAWHSRPQDVLVPLRRYLDRAFQIMLGFHGVKSSAERKRLVAAGAQHRFVQVLQNYPWRELAERMEAFDRRRALIRDAADAERQEGGEDA